MAYIGQSVQPDARAMAHQRKGPAKMRQALKLYQPFDQYFSVQKLAIVPAGRLANRAEAGLIAAHNTLWPHGYNILKGTPLSDARYHAWRAHAAAPPRRKPPA